MNEATFDLALAHGRCVGVAVPEGSAVDDLAAMLESAERDFSLTLSAIRRRTWVAGRVAMREALARLGVVGVAILSDARGAPRMPEGISGSISHKRNVAAALVARAPAARVGLDVEDDVVGAVDISRHVLSPGEAEELAGLAGPERSREVLLRFSAKEAVYKALDPFVQRYVAFREVSVVPEADGGARVDLRLAGGEGPFSVEVRWRRFSGLVLTTARVERPETKTTGR
jgi:4'-phosphopantetheinyl transferase EntD